jgi:ABC-type transporter Mla MlaB component
MDDVVEVAVQPQGGYVVARLSGQLSLQTVVAARQALVELLGKAGCVVADLSGLGLRDPECVAVFSAAVRLAGGWPRAKLALFGAAPRMLAQLRRLGVGDAVPVADGLDGALAAAGGPPGAWPSGVIVTDEQGISGVLAAAERNEGLARFVRHWLGALIDHDAPQHSELVRTLSVYLDCGDDYEEASRRLGVHRSTVRYRVQRIRELTGLDLYDADTRLILHAATRARARLSAYS